MYVKRAWDGAETFAVLLPRQGCAILGPRTVLRVIFFLLMEGNVQPTDTGKGKAS